MNERAIIVEEKEQLNGSNWVAIIRAMEAAVTAQKEDLSRLDAKVGDGDHGINMAAGLTKAASKVEQLSQPTPSMVLKTTGSSLMNDMGGASGMVFGAFFRGCANAVKDIKALTRQDIGQMLSAALAYVEKRGKVQPGDKTMVDALAPAVSAYKDAINNGLGLQDALGSAADAAKAGALSTVEMVAKVGRAKFLGERSLGHQDAGATTMALLFSAWVNCLDDQSCR